MKITNLRVFKGRNIYSHKPCIKIDIDLQELKDTPTCNIPNFNNLLLEFVPTLKEHKCSRGYKGGFVERLHEGTYLAHVFEHVCLEIQNILGYDVAYGKARMTNKNNIYIVVFEYKSETVALEVVNIVLQLLNDICYGKSYINFRDSLENLKVKIPELELGPSTLAIKEEAEKREIPIIRLGNGSLLQLGYGKYSKRIQATITENTSCIATDISCDKQLTKELLSIAGIPVPEGYTCSNIKEAISSAERIGYPVVLKPNNGNQGKGVSLNLRNDKDITDAFNIAKQFCDKVLVERFVEGKHYRILVVDNRVIACSERVAAHVKGNGKNTVRELIDIENNNPLRGDGHEKPLTKIKIEPVMELLLRKNNISLDYIPKKEEIVYLRENDNLSTGGIAIDVTDQIHPDNISIAVNSTKIIGLDVAGIDITTKDIKQSMLKDNGAVIEVNAAPGIRMHHYPTKGKQINVAKSIVDMLFPEGSEHTIPIVSVTGTNGKTTTTRMISSILKEKGYTVGMTTTSGIFIDGECIMKGDTTGPISAQSILMNKKVDAAVLETARGGIVNRGLGYDLADIGIITNITEDHLGIDEINNLEDLSHVKSLVVEAVRENGYAVLNGDDKYCLKIGKNLRGNIIYFTKEKGNDIIEEHMSNGGKAVYIHDGTIFVYDGKKENMVMGISEIPATLNGVLDFNIDNSLAAVAGAYGLGIEISVIKEALKKFDADTNINPGRFNVHNVRDFKVIVDYGHNIDGYRRVLSAIRGIKNRRVIGVIGVPGDRTETSTVKVGQVCGENLDHIIIKEDKDLRGRKPGEIAKFLRNGCMIGGRNKEAIEIILAEEEALRKAIQLAQKDDIIIVFYEDYEAVMKVINEASQDSKEIKVNEMSKMNA